jgi:LPXTG-motif cell wall-anchored protein
VKKLILALATVAFVGMGASAASAQTAPKPIRPGAPPVCAEWNGQAPIPEVCVDFYVERAQIPPATTTPTTVPATVPAQGLPKTGSGVSPILGIGALLIAGGGIVVVATRRRSTASPAH